MTIKIKNLNKFNLYQTMWEMKSACGIKEFSPGFLAGLFQKIDGGAVSRSFIHLVMRELVESGAVKKVSRGRYEVLER